MKLWASRVVLFLTRDFMLLPTSLSMVGKSGWVGKEREREREREGTFCSCLFLFCLRDFLGQIEAVTIKPKRNKKMALYIIEAVVI